MAAPGLLVVDSAAGILVAGMICMTGIEVLFESVKQLADTGDYRLENKVTEIARNVEGVLGVKNAKSRTVGSGTLIDVNIMTDSSITTSAANNIMEKLRWSIIENIPNAMEVAVRNHPMETVCPLLTQSTRSIPIVEREVRDLLSKHCDEGIIKNIKKIHVSYISTAMLSIELVLSLDPAIKEVEKATAIGKNIQSDIKTKIPDVFQAEVLLDIGGGDEALDLGNFIKSMPLESLTSAKQ